jgi:hypothetical protein
MLKTGVLLLMGALAFGQEATPAPSNAQGETSSATSQREVALQKPSLADVYCAGFVTKQPVSHESFIAGGLHSPHAVHYMNGEVVYLSGRNYHVGQQLTLLRELRDPNRYEDFMGQTKLLAATGQPYSELGQAHVIDTRQKMAIAKIDFLCEPAVPGDLAVSRIEHANFNYRRPEHFDVFAPPNNKLTGRIVLARDFDTVLGNGAKVYLSIGAQQGVKAGDYYRIFRTYQTDLEQPIDSLSFKASYAEDTQKHPAHIATGRWDKYSRHKGPEIKVKDMPRRSLGELLILSTSPTSATGMITFSLEDVHIGDGVELEDSAAVSAQVTQP